MPGTTHAFSLFNFYQDLLIFVFCAWLLPACVYIICVPGAREGQKRGSNPLEMELQVIVSYHVGCENWTYILCNSNKYP